MNAAKFQEIISNAVGTVFQGFGSGLSNLVGAVIILLVFWIIARTLRSLLTKVLGRLGLDGILEKIGLSQALENAGLKVTATGIVSQLIYWMIMLVGIVAASEAMGLTAISTEISKLIALIPRILTGMIIFVIGYYIAGIIRDVLGGATESLGVGAGKLIAGAIYWFLMIVITLTTLEQIGLSVDILSENVQLIIGAIVIAGAISYGLASRDLLRDTLSTYYGKNTFEVGQRISVDGVTGTIEEIGNISVILRTDKGRTVIPSSVLTGNKVEILD